MEHETIRGTLRYTSKKPQILDKVRGGETFIITRHVDGRQTMRAHCAIDENAPRVLRDVIMNLDPDWNPVSGLVQLTVDEKFVGSTWYHFTDTMAECEGFTVREGRISQKVALEGYAPVFGTHPIQGDAWTVRCYDLSKGPGKQIIPTYLMSSLHHRGADGPMLLLQRDLLLAYIGEETITVEAGTFDTLHFRITENDDDTYMGTDRHPPYHAWVTADGSYIMVKAYCTGYMQTYYELVEYERRTNFF